MSDYAVGRRGQGCAVTGRGFVDGQTVVTALYELGDGTRLARRDFTLEAFARTAGRLVVEEGKPATAPFAHWQTVLRRGAKHRLLVDDEALVAFFERLGGEQAPLRQQFRYVLALILMRKRILRYESCRLGGDGLERWQMTLVHPTLREGKGPLKRPVEVTRPEIDEAQVRQVSEQLDEILAGDDALAGSAA